MGFVSLTAGEGLCVHFDEAELAALFAKIQHLLQEIREEKPYQALLIHALFRELLVFFLRKYHTADEKPSPYSLPVAETLRYIHDHFREEIRVQDLADRRHLTAHYLGGLFLTEVGKSVLEYTTELRLQLAMQLLHTDMSMGAIGAECGFGTAVRDYYDKNGIAYAKSQFPDCEHCAHCHM